MSRQKFAELLEIESGIEVRSSKAEGARFSDDASELDLSECEIPLLSMKDRIQDRDNGDILAHVKRQEPWWDDAREVDLSLCEFTADQDFADVFS